MVRLKELFSSGSGIVYALLFVTGLLSGVTQAGAASNHEQSKNPTTTVNSDDELLDLAGPYLGQRVPGMTAELFAPGIVSVNGRYEFAISFAPGGDRALFTVQTGEEEVLLLHTRKVGSQWTRPAPVNLANGARKDEMEAFFAPDGRHVYFAPYDEGMDVRIWQVTVDGNDWRNPQPLTGAIAEDPAFYPTVANDGTLYYSNIKERRPYYSRQSDNDSWTAQPVQVDFGMHVLIEPSQSFLLLDARAEDSLGKGDIYVAFPSTEGGWTRPVNLGPEVNSKFGESCPSLSSDGKYLFFSRYDEDGGVAQIYWVDAKVITQTQKSILNANRVD